MSTLPFGRRPTLSQDQPRGRIVDDDGLTFAAMAAHELKSAIGALTLHAGAAASQAASTDSPELAASLHRLVVQAERLQQTCHQLLDLAQLRRRGASLDDGGELIGRVDLERPAVDVADAIAELLDSLEPEVTKNVELGLDDRLAVACDERSLQSIVSNLVQNAHKHGAGTVRVTGSRVDGHVVITVDDEGPGVPSELVPTIFEPFVRSRDRQDGAGLGLAIVAELARELGGDVAYERLLPRGARFIVSLPSA